MRAQSQPVSWLAVDAWVQFRVGMCVLHVSVCLVLYVCACHVSFLGFR